VAIAGDVCLDMPRGDRAVPRLTGQSRRKTAALLIAIMVAALVGDPAGQTPFSVQELAQYRLTTPVFTRFTAASRSIAATIRTDPALQQDPLFSREIVLSDDARAAATALESRLRTHLAIVRALADAKLSARDYTTFVIALVAARLAHGFVQSGAMRRIPEGPAASNVAFVDAHQSEVAALLADLGIDG